MARGQNAIGIFYRGSKIGSRTRQNDTRDSGWIHVHIELPEKTSTRHPPDNPTLNIQGPTLLLHRVHDFLERSRAFGRPDCDNWHCRYAREQIGYLARKERGWMRRADVQSFTVNYVSRHSHTKADHLGKGAWLPRSFTLSTINLTTFSFRSTG